MVEYDEKGMCRVAEADIEGALRIRASRPARVYHQASLMNEGHLVLRSLTKRVLRSCGFDVRRYAPASSEAARLMAVLRTHKINTIFDVGPNEGQFAKMLRNEGYQGRIVSLGPLSSAWERLKAETKNDPLWEVAPRGAIGSAEG